RPVVLRTRIDATGPIQRALVECESDTPSAVLAGLREETTLAERIDPARTDVWIFGAGHVGSALVRTLAGMPYRITWVDSREEQFAPSLTGKLPDDVTVLVSDTPADEAKHAPPGAFHIVLTHSHDLDYDICKALLARGDFAWTGLIGSKTKAAKFRHRMERQGFTPQQIARITCPIGVDGIDSKLPAAIAIAVSAQLLRAVESSTLKSSRDSGEEGPTAATAAGQREQHRAEKRLDSRSRRNDDLAARKS